MTPLVLPALLLAATLQPGPVYVRSVSVTARSCPKATCNAAGDLKGGEALQLSEVQAEWGKVSSAKRSVTGWVEVKDLAAGNPSSAEVQADSKIYDCPKATCKVVGDAKKGASVIVVDGAGEAPLVRAGEVVGYILDGKALKAPATATTAAPAYVPPTEAPKYIPPAEAPKYIPPAEKPRYIPADSPPVYIPPAQPAATAAGKPGAPGVMYVRRASADIRNSSQATAKVSQSMPGGAKLYVRKTQGDFVQVSTSEGDAAPALGYIARADLRDVPPLIYKVKSDKLGYRTCLDAQNRKCAETAAKGLKAGDSLVSIDESPDKIMLLVLISGMKTPWVWVKAVDLEPAR